MAEEITKKQYILHYILKPDFVSEEELHAARQLINEKVESAGGAIEASLCQDSIRRLAYPINKVERGYLCEAAFNIDTQSVGTLRNNLKRELSILRYIIESRHPLEKIKPARRLRFPRESKETIPSTQPSTPITSGEKREKISIEELDRKLEEIIKNI